MRHCIAAPAGRAGGNHTVDEGSMVKLCLLLEGDEHRRTLHPENLGEEFYPERLALALLISPALPSLDEGSGSYALLFLCFHIVK